MKEEFKVFIRKPMVWFSLILLAYAIAFNSVQLPDTSTYDALYEEYQDSVEAYRNNYFLGKIPTSDATDELGEQWEYLTKIVANEFANNVKGAKSRLNSSLFADEKDEVEKELAFEENRLNANITFANIYQNDSVLKNDLLCFTLLIIGIISIVSMFYDDIEDQSVKLFHTLECHLPNIFARKYLCYVLWMFILCVIGCAVDLLCTKGNYTIYNLPAFQNTFMNLTVHQYLMWKYFNCFLNVLLVSFLFLFVLLLSRNHVTGVIISGIILFVSYLSYIGITDGNTLMILKYANAYHWLFTDQYEYSSIYMISVIIKIIVCAVMAALTFLVYVREIHVRPLIQKGISLRSVNPCMHIMYEVYVESKGLLAILFVVLFGIYNISTFQVSKGSTDDAYQEFKKDYLGEVTEETYQGICDDYDDISKAYDEAQSIYEQAAELSLQEDLYADGEDPIMELYMDNATVLTKANKMQYISTLKAEYEEAMELGTKTLIDDRSGNLLLMANQRMLRIESFAVVVVPLLAVCLYHCFLVRRKERYLLIHTSSLGLKVTKKLNHITYFVMIVIDVIIAICMHVYKVSSGYTIDYTNTLNDLLLSSRNIPLWAVLIITGMITTAGTYIVILLIEKAMDRYFKVA